jgi:hypothetical protein
MKTIPELKANLIDLQRERDRLTALIAEVELVIENETVAACKHKAGDIIKLPGGDVLIRNVYGYADGSVILNVSNRLVSGRWSKHTYGYEL